MSKTRMEKLPPEEFREKLKVFLLRVTQEMNSFGISLEDEFYDLFPEEK